MLNLSGFKKMFGLCRDDRGSISLITAAALPVLIGVVGLSIDMAQYYLTQERLSRALDAAALAAGASPDGSTDAQIEARVNEFIQANYPSEKIGKYVDFDVVINGNDITVSGTARLDKGLLWVAGIDQIEVRKSTSVRKQIKGVEAVLVLDNTGSMSYVPPGGSVANIDSLKTAATKFVTIMFDKAQKASDVRIGIVPYANSVRIGQYGLGYLPDGVTRYQDRDGNNIDPFVTLPPGVSYTNDPNSSTGWYGCVVEHLDTDYDSAATHVAGSYGQLWNTSGGAWDGHGWNPGVSNNDPDPQDYTDDYTGPWDIYMYGRIITQNSRCSSLGSGYSNAAASCSNCTKTFFYNGSNYANSCNSTYCYCKYTRPANSCPRSNVLPLTSSETDLATAIGTMQASGNTQGNTGMLWGYRLISPEAPFTEGSEWGSEHWTKAVIMMTDGDNTMDNSYSYQWVKSRLAAVPGTSSKTTNLNAIGVNGVTTKGLNQRFAEVCDALKAQTPPVLIYTIVFQSETAVSDANKQFYRDCATNADMYFDAPTQAALEDTFEHIARELSNLHITD